jgi:FkbM family methyltransferase
MNFRSLVHLLGWRPAPVVYGHEVVSFNLPGHGRVELARWLHPNERPKIIRQDEINHLRSFLRPGDVAIDIGAHTGDTAVPMAIALGPTGLVVAVEPNPYVFPVLEKNATLNRQQAVIVPLNFAVTERPEPIEFTYSDSGFCNGGRHEGVSRWRHAHAFRLTVRGENLASHLAANLAETAGRIRFIKVDAEGGDRRVLESMASVIDRERPFLRAEVHKTTDRDERQRLFDWLTARNYAVFRVESEVNYRGQRLGRDDLSRWRQFDVFAVPSA